MAVFYHARIVSKPDHARGAVRVASENDLTREDILLKIAVPLVQKKQFFCGGAVINPDKVQETRFSRTRQSSKELEPLINARQKMYSNISFLPPESDMIWEGEDVTREILDEAGRFSKSGMPEVERKTDRIFVVHGHDDRAVDQTELLIHRFKLTPIILRNAPNEGRTVLEKFEAHSNVGFAIVLLTADDVGARVLPNYFQEPDRT
jgi:hypothetical protein